MAAPLSWQCGQNPLLSTELWALLVSSTVRKPQILALPGETATQPTQTNAISRDPEKFLHYLDIGCDLKPLASGRQLQPLQGKSGFKMTFVKRVSGIAGLASTGPAMVTPTPQTSYWHPR